MLCSHDNHQSLDMRFLEAANLSPTPSSGESDEVLFPSKESSFDDLRKQTAVVSVDPVLGHRKEATDVGLIFLEGFKFEVSRTLSNMSTKIRSCQNPFHD